MREQLYLAAGKGCRCLGCCRRLCAWLCNYTMTNLQGTAAKRYIQKQATLGCGSERRIVQYYSSRTKPLCPWQRLIGLLRSLLYGGLNVFHFWLYALPQPSPSQSKLLPIATQEGAYDLLRKATQTSIPRITFSRLQTRCRDWKISCENPKKTLESNMTRSISQWIFLDDMV